MHVNPSVITFNILKYYIKGTFGKDLSAIIAVGLFVDLPLVGVTCFRQVAYMPGLCISTQVPGELGFSAVGFYPPIFFLSLFYSKVMTYTYIVKAVSF